MTVAYATEPGRLVVAGLGYSGSAVARDAAAAGWQVVGTARDPARAGPAGAGGRGGGAGRARARAEPPRGVAGVGFAPAALAISAEGHGLGPAAPLAAGLGEAGDPILAADAAAIAAAEDLRWIGSL